MGLLSLVLWGGKNDFTWEFCIHLHLTKYAPLLEILVDSGLVTSSLRYAIPPSGHPFVIQSWICLVCLFCDTTFRRNISANTWWVSSKDPVLAKTSDLRFPPLQNSALQNRKLIVLQPINESASSADCTRLQGPTFQGNDSAGREQYLGWPLMICTMCSTHENQ